MRTTLRVPLAAACAAGLLATPALALDTSIRVEGASANLVPESAIPIEGAGTATVFDSVGTETTVGRGTAFWQLVRATSSTGLGLGFTYFASFDAVLVDRIGPDANAGSAGWQYRVNRVAPSVGASSATLAQGDRVLWYYGGADAARELDLAVSSDRVSAGATFTATVTSFDAAGAAAPAAGAVVRYGGTQATADAAGAVTLVAQGTGGQPVTATRAGDIRSPARAVCSFAGDPTVCNLPPAPTPAGGAAGAAGADAVAPGSRIAFPRIGRATARVRAIRGTAGPDRSDIARVEVALARRVGTQCRFRTRSGGLTAPRPCSRQVYVRTRSVGSDWILPLKRPLTPGLWRVWSRAIDGAGNREGIGLARINTGQFRVVGN